MEQGKIYNLESARIGDQDTWIAWSANNDAVYYVGEYSQKTYESYTAFTYELNDASAPKSIDTTDSNLQYQVVFYVEGKISNLIDKIEVNGEEYLLTDLINDDSGENITLDEEIEDSIGMMLPKSGIIKFYLKFPQAIEMEKYFNDCVSRIDQVGCIYPYFWKFDNLEIFNFDSETTLKQIFYYSKLEGYGIFYLCYSYAPIYINNINTSSLYFSINDKGDEISIENAPC